MICPYCHKNTITFEQWLKNTTSWTCPHCQARLKATRVTWVCVIAVTILVFFITALVIGLEEVGIIPAGPDMFGGSPGHTYLIVACLLVIIPLCWFLYNHVCGYEVEAPPPKKY